MPEPPRKDFWGARTRGTIISTSTVDAFEHFKFVFTRVSTTWRAKNIIIFSTNVFVTCLDRFHKHVRRYLTYMF